MKTSQLRNRHYLFIVSLRPLLEATLLLQLPYNSDFLDCITAKLSCFLCTSFNVARYSLMIKLAFYRCNHSYIYFLSFVMCHHIKPPSGWLVHLTAQDAFPGVSRWVYRATVSARVAFLTTRHTSPYLAKLYSVSSCGVGFGEATDPPGGSSWMTFASQRVKGFMSSW